MIQATAKEIEPRASKRRRMPSNRFTAWPETAQDCANVLCEGPSILGASQLDLLPGPVVAVNRAICLSGTFPVDVWATTDDPRLLWSWAQPYLPEGVRFLSCENCIPIFHKLLGMRGVSRKLYAPNPIFMDAKEETGEVYIGEDGKPPLLPTVIHTIGWLARIGVKHVRLFGCDMKGEGSPLGPIPYSEQASEGGRFRWSVERTLVALCMKSYRKENRRLERWAKKASR